MNQVEEFSKGRDLQQRLDRRADVLLAVAMPLGPLLVAVLRAVMPTFSAQTAHATAAAVAAHPGRQNLTVWLGTAAIAVLVPGVLAAGKLTRAAAPAAVSHAPGWAPGAARTANRAATCCERHRSADRLFCAFPPIVTS